MKMTLKKKKILLITFLCILLACLIFNQLIQNLFSIGWSYISKPDLKYVKEKEWEYDAGFQIGEGDFVEFDSSNFFQLRHDTIFYKGSPRARVLRINKRFYEMKVKSIQGDSLGTYINIEEHLR